MSNENTEDGMGSRPEWDHLEDWLRGQVQGLIQHVLEEEGDGVPGQGEVGATVGFRQRQWLPERALTFPEADSVIGDDTSEEAEGTRHRGEVCEQAVAAVRQEEQTDRRVDS